MVTIKYKRKKYKFLFTIWAWYICCDELDIELHEIEAKGESMGNKPMSDNLIYGAYIAACLSERRDILLSKKKMFWLIGKMQVEDYQILQEAMLSAKIMGRKVGNIMEEKKT